MDDTLNYYDKFAKTFFEKTVELDMQHFYNVFEKFLFSGSRILDFGCGSGRDSKYFLSKGYSVVSMDGSPKMCEIASKYIGKNVLCQKFDEIKFENEFDGIWASASLLHIPKKNLKDIFKLLYKALKDDGYMYISFKYGKYEGVIGERYFSYLNYDELNSMIDENFKILVKMKTEDLRFGNCNNKWMNVILKKCL